MASIKAMEEMLDSREAMSATGNDPYKVYLDEDEIPTHYYNVRADMKTDHRPIINPGTMQPATLEDLEPVF